MTLIYKSDFIAETASVIMFHKLWSELTWERRSDAPRFEYWTNRIDRDYTYGRGAGVRTYSSQKEHSEIAEVNRLLAEEVGFEFEGCFLNGYDANRNRPDWLGWHEDDDPGIDHTKPIAIVTLYGSATPNTRSLFTREKLGTDSATGKMVFGPVVETVLGNGSLVLMPAGFQATHQHAILKPSGKWDSRISLTYRALI